MRTGLLIRLGLAASALAWPAFGVDNLDPRQAMEQVMQKAPLTAKGCGSWTLSPEETRRRVQANQGSPVKPVWTLCPYQWHPFRQQGKERAYLLLKAEPAGDNGNDCHMCSPMLGAAIFEKRPTGWSLVRQQRDLAPGLGTFGQLAPAKLVALSPDRHGIQVSSGYTGMGINTLRQVLFVENGQGLAEVWNELTDSDNRGIGPSLPKYRFTSRLSFVPVKGQVWPELHQIVSGTALKEVQGRQRAVSVAGTRIFRFDGKRYRPIKGYFRLQA